MTVEKAVNMLFAEYERALRLKFVYNPLAYALYRVWRKADGEREDNA